MKVNITTTNDNILFIALLFILFHLIFARGCHAKILSVKIVVKLETDECIDIK